MKKLQIIVGALIFALLLFVSSCSNTTNTLPTVERNFLIPKGYKPSSNLKPVTTKNQMLNVSNILFEGIKKYEEAVTEALISSNEYKTIQESLNSFASEAQNKELEKKDFNIAYYKKLNNKIINNNNVKIDLKELLSENKVTYKSNTNKKTKEEHTIMNYVSTIHNPQIIKSNINNDAIKAISLALNKENIYQIISNNGKYESSNISKLNKSGTILFETDQYYGLCKYELKKEKESELDGFLAFYDLEGNRTYIEIINNKTNH